MKNLIIAGGVGSRLWPLSRELMPKQFLKLFSGKSLFQKTIEKNRDFVDEFIIVLNEEYYFLALDQLEEVAVKNYRFIIEPFEKNTAPAIAFGSLEVDDISFVTPADHLIDGRKEYKEAVEKAGDLAEKDYLVTFGINPSFANTGYRYIEADGEDVIKFHEKPDLEKVKEYLKKAIYIGIVECLCLNRVYI